jgi:surface protein
LPNGNNENWFSVASNSEGDRLFATGFKYFYMSINGGTTWTPITIAGVPSNLNYYCVESNATGQYLAVTLNINTNNLVYTSNNYGNTWTLSLTIPKLTNTTSCDITGNSSGSKLIAWAIGDDDDNIYISSNYGGSWEIQTQLPPTVGQKGYWNSVACNPSGSKLIAIINYSYDVGAIFTWSDSTNQWSKINDNLLPSTPFGVCAITNSDYFYFFNYNTFFIMILNGQTPTIYNLPTMNPVPNAWISVASDYTGKYAIAGSESAGVYLSSNYGSSWRLVEIQTLPSTRNRLWYVASNSTGSILVACQRLEFVYISTNSGTNWTQQNIPSGTNKTWTNVSCNSTGSTVIVCNDSRMYITKNYGGTWNTLNPISPSPNTFNAKISNDSTGNILFAAINTYSDIIINPDVDDINNPDYIYRSTNAGTNWSQLSIAKNKWNSIACNSTGSVIIACTNNTGGNNLIYLSLNSGNTWNQLNTNQLPQLNNFARVASNASGSTLVVSNYSSDSNGGVFISRDYGVTWTDQTNLSSSATTLPIFSNFDGDLVYTGTYQENIWLLTTHMLLQVSTTVSSSYIALPITGIFGGVVTTDWGDGTIDNLTSHTYAAAGSYTISISDNFTGFTNPTPTPWLGAQSLVAVLSWNSSLQNIYGAFAGLINLTSVPNYLPSGVTNLDYLFYNTVAFNSPNVSQWDTRNVTSMRYLFNGAKSFNRVLTWYVDSLLNMDFMFYNSIYSNYVTFTTTALQPWPLLSMQSAFENTLGITVNWLQWDTARVTNMSSAFRNAVIIDISGVASWNTGAVTNMSYLFYNANYGGITIPAGILQWNTAAVTDMSYLFYGSQAFGVSSYVTYYVDSLVIADYMFANSNFRGGVQFSTQIVGAAWPLQTVSYMFYNVPLFSGSDSNISTWDTRRVTTTAHMFDCSTSSSPGVFNQSLNWTIDRLVVASYMFANQRSLNSPIRFTTT